MRDASKLWPCWPIAHAVTRERDRGWPGVGPGWRWLCSDITRDRPPSKGDKPKAVRLTTPQVELLTDIATKPCMYITYGSRWDRVATALIRKDLASNRFVGGRQYELRITEAGKVEATRRDIADERR